MSLHFSGMFLSARGGDFEVDKSYFVCVGHVVSGREWVLGSRDLLFGGSRNCHQLFSHLEVAASG